jgi:hypothetical protein
MMGDRATADDGTVQEGRRRGDATPVYVFGMGYAPPGRVVFHSPGPHDLEGGRCPRGALHRRLVVRTACGRITYLGACIDHHPTDDGRCHSLDLATRLRRDHAELLGRLCKGCARSEAADA